MSDKLNDSKVEKVSAGYETPDAQTGSETETGILLVQISTNIILTVNPTTAPTVMPTTVPTVMPVVAPTLMTSALTPPGSVPPDSAENK